MVTQHPKVLRLGIIQGGKIIEERLFRVRQPVSIGQSDRNTIVVPQSNLPSSFPVFQLQGDQYLLAFGAGMEGRIQGAQGAVDLATLVSQGLARKIAGDLYVVPLRDDQRGRVVLGEATLLFQFVAPPPEPPRPVLPESVKGRHFQTLDRLFVAVLVFSAALHYGAYVALARTPDRQEITLEEMPQRFARILMPERRPEAFRKEEKRTAEAVPVAKKEPEPVNRTGAPRDAPAGRAERAAAVAKAVQSKGLLRVLGTLGNGSGQSAAISDVLGGGGGYGDVAKALQGSGGVAVATDPGVVGGRKGGGQGTAARIGDLATSGGAGGKVGLGKKSEARVAGVSGSVATEVAEVESSDIDQAKLGSFVRVRINSLKACYENQLKRNPNLRGKIRIEFTILETGGLTDVRVLENTLGSSEVASCIVGVMRGWRTPFHPSGTVTVVYPFVFSAS